jgi:sulfur dioxygenase
MHEGGLTMLLRQFNFEGCLSYILACETERAGVIIDPSHEIEPYLRYIKEKGLTVLYVIDTHTHVDHVSLSPELADLCGTRTVMSAGTPLQREIGAGAKDLFGIEKIIAENGTKRVDLYLGNGEELKFGGVTLKALATPGHTKDSLSLFVDGRVFTGDALLIGQCGRTDLPGGSYQDMHETLFRRFHPLSDDLIIYPAHDYRGNINSSLGYEKVNNVCLKVKREVEEFGAFLKGLFPPLDAAGAKLQCGLTADAGPSPAVPSDLNPLMHSFCVSMEQYLDAPQEGTMIRPAQLLELLQGGQKMLLLDVRQPEELSTRGYIKGALNIPVREVPKRAGELPTDLDFPIVTICESGARSALAALYLRAYGYSSVKNLEYGMRGWRTEGFPLAYPES